MKTIMQRAVAAALSLVMTAGLLSGCGSAYDPIQEAMGYPGSTVMMTVNGSDVTAEEFLFWMAQNADSVTSFYSSMGMEMDWTAPAGEDMTMDQYVKEQSKQSAILYEVVSAKAKEYGYEMTKEDETAYEADLDAAMEQLGGEEAYDDFLKSMLITAEGMKDLSSVGVLYAHMGDGLCREGGEYAPTEEELAAYIESSDLLAAKHILLMTQDPATGEALSAEDAAAKKATAEDILAQLQAITDPAELESKFDELMNEHSEDTGLAANPDGYLFTAGEMVEEFESATRALGFGQVSGIVESPFGYHIILRLDPAQSDVLLDDWTSTKMDELVAQWVAEAEVVTTETFDNLTTATFYEKLTAYRDSLLPEEETPAEGEEGAAEEGAEPAGEESETPPAEGEAAEGEAAE